MGSASYSRTRMIRIANALAVEPPRVTEIVCEEWLGLPAQAASG